MLNSEFSQSIFILIVTVTVVALLSVLCLVLPNLFAMSVTHSDSTPPPLTALQLAGRDIYVREGCYTCHSQMIRPFISETERYGPYSVAGEFIYDHPFQWGSKRTGPDLARVGGRYSDAWHRAHLIDPQSVVP